MTVLFVFPNIREFCAFLPSIPLELLYKRGCCTFFLVQQPQYLIDRLGVETDKYILASILDQIARLRIPREVNMDHVIKCSRNDKWLVRHSAIIALRSSDSEACREAARHWAKQVDEKQYKFEIIYANACLNEIGVMEDIELLDMHTHSGCRDIKNSALYAIESIKRRVSEN